MDPFGTANFGTATFPVKRWCPAPYQGEPITTGSLHGVFIDYDEEVDWMWSHGPSGSHVVGYTIRKKENKDVDKS